jgi:transposase
VFFQLDGDGIHGRTRNEIRNLLLIKIIPVIASEMKQSPPIGLDLAQNLFQVHGIHLDGEVIVRKQLKRSQLRQFFAKLAPYLVGMEACGGAYYWSRELTRLGHTFRMMAPAFVKPYLKSNKKDPNDAEAICEAVQRRSMRFVAAKTLEQQSVLHLHHARRLLVRQRVALSNHMRGVLSEYGIALPQGVKVISRRLPELLEDADNEADANPSSAGRTQGRTRSADGTD